MPPVLRAGAHGARAAAVLLAMCASGCLYEQPLAPGTAEPVDARLLGTWRCITPESDEIGRLTVAEAPDHRYRAEFGGGDDEPTVFSAYAVTFASERLVNAQEVVAGEPKKWTVARYTLYRRNLLHLEFAREEAFRGAATPAERSKTLGRALKDGQVFEDFSTCVRVSMK